MNDYGRIGVCGDLALCNNQMLNNTNNKFDDLHKTFMMRQLKMQGFIVWHWSDRWMEAIERNKNWIDEGKIKYYETVLNGFENAPRALIDIFRGVYCGRVIIKV